MPVWAIILLLGCAGAVGGVINAFLANEGLVLFHTDQIPSGPRIWRPGFVGNVFVGAVTAVVLAGLYSPVGSMRLASTADFEITIGMLAGALLSGIGGARLLTNEVNKRYEEVTRENLGNAIDDLSQRPAVPPPEEKNS
jgi:hypothetical protein